MEYLIVAKAAVLDVSDATLCDWVEQKNINLQRGLRHFFKTLGAFVHSSRESQQISHKYENVKEEVETAFSMILIIFQMYRHLLFTIYMPNLNWYISYYYPDMVDKIKRLKSILDEDKKKLSLSARRVVNFYNRKWIFKQLPPLPKSRKLKLDEYRKRSTE